MFKFINKAYCDIKDILTRNPIEVAQRKNIIEQVEEFSTWDIQYISLLTFSSIIATCGLLINNNAVIIGAMVIAPMTWPVLRVGMAMVKGDMRSFLIAFFTLFLSIIFALSVVMLTTAFIPFKTVTPEMVNRINPSFIDIIIAASAGAVAAMATAIPKVSSVISGVAIAASILPPLCTIGIGFMLDDVDVTYGSSLLFIANILTIMLVSGLVFRILGFKVKRREEDRRNMYIAMTISTFLFIAFLIPLTYFVAESYESAQIKQESTLLLEQEIQDIRPESTLRIINIHNFPEYIRVEADVLIPHDKVPKFTMEGIVERALEVRLGKGAVVKLNVIPVFIDSRFPEKEETQKTIQAESS
jgi:uncharacterized hydrophobic protein (TIGR00271 family)